MARPRTLDLTDQQQRVLELMARGRTNYDIAQDLGVSLEGAKYHIRQVFDKLGVDSREEAVAAWKASRGNVFERVRGWLWPVGAVAVGGAAVVAAVVVGAIVFGAAFSGGSESVPAGVWVAQIVPRDASNPSGVGTLKVFNAEDPASAQTLPGTYVVGNGSPSEIEWSPDGRHLAVRSPQSPGLVVLSRDDKGWANPVDFEAREFFSWSPDSKVLGVLGLRSSLVDTRGRVVSQFEVPLTGSENSSSNVDGPLAWAPSNPHMFAAGASNHLIVLEPSGGHAYQPPASGDWIVTATGWQDDQTVLVSITSTPSPITVKSFAVTLHGDTADWAERTDAVSTTTSLPMPDAAVVAQWHDASNGIVPVGRTRDGSGVVYGPDLGYPFDPNSGLDYQAVVQTDDGRVYSVDLGMLSIGGATGPSRAFNIVITK
jgi:DNA-binding CsgD family transcriptional regulator